MGVSMRERREIAQRARSAAWGHRTASWHLWRAALPWALLVGAMVGAVVLGRVVAGSVSSTPSLPDWSWPHVSVLSVLGWLPWLAVVAVAVWLGFGLAVRYHRGYPRWRTWWRPFG